MLQLLVTLPMTSKILMHPNSEKPKKKNSLTWSLTKRIIKSDNAAHDNVVDFNGGRVEWSADSNKGV